MKKIFCLFLLFFSFYIVFAQKLDTEGSIEKKIEDLASDKTINDALKERRLLDLKSKSENIGYKYGILSSGSQLMKLYLFQSRDKEVVELGEKLKKISIKGNDSKYIISSIYRRNALSLGNLGLDDASIKDFRTAIRYAEMLEDENEKLFLLSQLYENITLYYNNKQFENKKNTDSIVFYLGKSLEMAKAVADNNKAISNDLKYYQIGFTKMRLGIFYLERVNVAGNLSLAEKHLKDGLKIYESKKYNISVDDMVMMLNQISWLYMEKKDHYKSIHYAKQAMELEKQFSDPYHRVESFEFLANGYMEIGDKEKSRYFMGKFSYLKDSLKYADKNNANKVMVNLVSNAKGEHDSISQKQWMFISLLSSLLLVVLALWRVKNRKMRRNYDQMIQKLKNETVILPMSADDETNTLSKSVKIESIISDDTERKILSKLENFENSELITRKDLNLAYLSSRFGTNAKYLSYIIKKHRGQNFISYINKLRIDFIVHKLYSDPNYREYKISYLADNCGFASYQVFVTAFKKINGVAPNYFIRNLINEEKK